MNQAELRQLIDETIAGDISPERHQALQRKLKSDPLARAVFRQIVDLDASLRTWAAERDGREAESVVRQAGNGRRRLPQVFAILAAAAAIAILAGWFWHRVPAGNTNHPQVAVVEPAGHLGTLVQQKNCVWEPPQPATNSSRFRTGLASLTSGVAKLQFDSGTNVVMQGPCRLEVLSADTALLLAGNVVVQVTELSDGFTLKTPEAAILDEGTEYAVSLDDRATEVHVFDGCVFWEPVPGAQELTLERIEAGEARRYTRSQPGSGARIPLEQRKFVRQIEADVRENSGDGLLAYDGFENLAGRIRRGRSGFGWSGGWLPEPRGHNSAGTIVDSPDDVVFGMDRVGRRLLALADGEAVSRGLEIPLDLESVGVYYLSCLVQRHAGEPRSGRYLQVSLCGDEGHPGRRSRNEWAFGATSDGFPFIKTGGLITQTAPPVEDDAVYLFVVKVALREHREVETQLRVYRAGEVVDAYEPSVWTIVGRPVSREFAPSRIRLATGSDTRVDIDELKFGTTWQAVTTAPQDESPPAASP